MHTNKEAKKPHVLLIVQMDFGENMRVFLHKNYQQSGSFLLCLVKVKFWCIKNGAKFLLLPRVAILKDKA